MATVPTVSAKSRSPTSTISSKGQFTVPMEIRRRLGVKEGDRVEFVVEDGRTILRPAATHDDPFEKCVGCLAGFNNMEEIIAWERDLRDPDKEYI